MAEPTPPSPEDLSIPAFLAHAGNQAELAQWMREHPHSFVAGTWTAPSTPRQAAFSIYNRGPSRGMPPSRPPGAPIPAWERVGHGTMLDPASLSMADFQQVAAAARRQARAPQTNDVIRISSARPPRATGGPPRTPLEQARLDRWQFTLGTIQRLEQDNPRLTYVTPPNWVPSETEVRQLETEAELARLRAATTATTPDSAMPQKRLNLARELERAGLKQTDDGKEAHHLVPKGGHRMTGNRHPRPAQGQLRRLGIDLNEAGNGAALTPSFHGRIHRERYFEHLNEMLRRAETKEDGLASLRALRDRLERDDTDYQNTEILPDWLKGKQ